MIYLQLEGIEYGLPEGWHEVSVAVFEEILRVAGLYDDYKSQVEYTLDMIAILTGAPIDSLKKMTRKSFDEIANKIDWVNSDVVASEKDLWNINGIEWTPLQNLDSLSMGDNISLELLIKDSKDSNILGNILPVLIRKVKKVEKDGELKKMPGEFDANEYEMTKKLLREGLMVSDVIKLKTFF